MDFSNRKSLKMHPLVFEKIRPGPRRDKKKKKKKKIIETVVVHWLSWEPLCRQNFYVFLYKE